MKGLSVPLLNLFLANAIEGFWGGEGLVSYPQDVHVAIHVMVNS